VVDAKSLEGLSGAHPGPFPDREFAGDRPLLANVHADRELTPHGGGAAPQPAGDRRVLHHAWVLVEPRSGAGLCFMPPRNGVWRVAKTASTTRSCAAGLPPQRSASAGGLERRKLREPHAGGGQGCPRTGAAPRPPHCCRGEVFLVRRRSDGGRHGGCSTAADAVPDAARLIPPGGLRDVAGRDEPVARVARAGADLYPSSAQRLRRRTLEAQATA
jgi:hypothetical protein